MYVLVAIIQHLTLSVRSPAAVPQQEKVLQQLLSAATEHSKCHTPSAGNLNHSKQFLTN